MSHLSGYKVGCMQSNQPNPEERSSDSSGSAPSGSSRPQPTTKAPGPQQPTGFLASPETAMIDAARLKPAEVAPAILPPDALSPEAQAHFQGYTTHDPEYRNIKFALFIAGFVTFAQIYEAQVLQPEISHTFSIQPVTASLSVSLVTLALAIAMFFIGPSSERLGRRPIVLISLFLTSFIGIVLAFSPTWHFLLIGRFVQGLALAGLPAVATAYLAEEINPKDLPRAAGSYVAGTGIGGMLGRVIAGSLSHILGGKEILFTLGAIHVSGWQATFGIIGCAGVFLSLLVWRLLPKQEGFVRADPGLRTLLEHTKAVLTERGMLLLFLIAATALGAYQSILNMIPYRLTAEPYLLATWLVSLIYLVTLFGSWAASFAGAMAARFGRRVVEPLSGVVLLVGSLLTLAKPLWAVILGLIVFTVGFFGVHSVATGWVTARAVAGVGATGQASSAYSIMYYAGGSFFGTIAGLGWSAFGWPGVVLISGILALLVCAFALILRKVPPLVSTGF